MLAFDWLVSYAWLVAFLFVSLLSCLIAWKVCTDIEETNRDHTDQPESDMEINEKQQLLASNAPRALEKKDKVYKARFNPNRLPVMDAYDEVQELLVDRLIGIEGSVSETNPNDLGRQTPSANVHTFRAVNSKKKKAKRSSSMITMFSNLFISGREHQKEETMKESGNSVSVLGLVRRLDTINEQELIRTQQGQHVAQQNQQQGQQTIQLPQQQQEQLALQQQRRSRRRGRDGRKGY